MHRTVIAAITARDEAAPVVALAVALARPVGAAVVLGAVAERGRLGHAHGDGRLERLGDRVAALAADVPADVPATVDRVEATSAVRGFHELVERHDAELLVIAHAQRHALGRALRGDRAAETVFTALCGVAVAGPDPVAHPPRRIGVAWDHTDEAGEALEWAVQLAERTAGTVEIVHVIGDHGADPSTHAAAEIELERLREAVLPRAEAQATVAWGDTERLLAHVGERADLLVMGSRRRSPLRRALTGSFSSSVMHAATCPVVVLPRGVTAPLDTAAT